MKANHNVLIVFAVLAMYVTSIAKADTLFCQISDIGDGSTQWSFPDAASRYTWTGYPGVVQECIILPESAFNFDYSQSFSLTFSSPIGMLEDLTSGISVPLNHIDYWQNINSLEIDGGSMNHSPGDVIQITYFSSAADIAIPLSQISAFDNGVIGAAYPGGWATNDGIEFEEIPVPEPSSIVLLSSASVLWLAGRRVA